MKCTAKVRRKGKSSVCGYAVMYCIKLYYDTSEAVEVDIQYCCVNPRKPHYTVWPGDGVPRYLSDLEDMVNTTLGLS